MNKQKFNYQFKLLKFNQNIINNNLKNLSNLIYSQSIHVPGSKHHNILQIIFQLYYNLYNKEIQQIMNQFTKVESILIKQLRTPKLYQSKQKHSKQNFQVCLIKLIQDINFDKLSYLELNNYCVDSIQSLQRINLINLKNLILYDLEINNVKSLRKINYPTLQVLKLPDTFYTKYCQNGLQQLKTNQKFIIIFGWGKSVKLLISHLAKNIKSHVKQQYGLYKCESIKLRKQRFAMFQQYPKILQYCNIQQSQ